MTTRPKASGAEHVMAMAIVVRFGPFVLDSQRRELTRDESPIAITPKAFDVLFYFVQHPNRIVPKQELMKAVWPDTIVEEGNLTQTISVLRKVLAEHGDDGLIVTVGRQGYQFKGDVTAAQPAAKRRDAEPRRRALVIGSAVVLAVLITAGVA